MAVTNYFTVDGQIQGEETGGTFTGYVPDALGSVTATVSSAGAVQNTYRYKPYGELLAKTGGAADPNFQWTGMHGIRIAVDEWVYGRNYHLSVLSGQLCHVSMDWPETAAYVPFAVTQEASLPSRTQDQNIWPFFKELCNTPIPHGCSSSCREVTGKPFLCCNSMQVTYRKYGVKVTVCCERHCSEIKCLPQPSCEHPKHCKSGFSVSSGSAYIDARCRRDTGQCVLNWGYPA